MKFLQKYKFLFSLLVWSCANPGIPPGGPVDRDPPVVENTSPKNFSTRFKNKQIIIRFNEFVQLKNVQQSFIISPPQKIKPKIFLKGKSIEVKIIDTLRKHTTYVMDFGSAIVDNNEQLPLGDYRYVFSTGTHIDSLGIAGFVKNAFDHQIPENILVCLFHQKKDLNDLYGKIPRHVGRIDSAGFFMLGNIPDSTYTLVAIQDLNRNAVIDPDEPISFYDSVIIPSQLLSSQKTSLDSLRFDDKTSVGTIAENLFLFTELPSVQYLVEYNRSKRYLLYFQFNTHRTDTLKIDFLGIDEKPQWYLPESSKTNDTLHYWIVDSSLYSRDTLLAELTYLQTDSIGKLMSYRDTVKLNFKTPKRKRKKTTKKKQLEISGNIQNVVEIPQKLFIEFTEPVIEFSKEKIQIHQVIDTVVIEKNFSIEPDLQKPFLKYWIDMQWQPEENYQLQIDSASVKSIYGLQNNKFNKSFYIRELDFYGKIFVDIKNVPENIIVQLIENNRGEKIKYQKYVKKSGLVIFDYIKPANYRLKVIYDKNNDGKWTTGDFKKRKQAEKVIYHNEKINVRSNWEVEINWILPQ